MFYFDGLVMKSDLLDVQGIAHGFSTRNGGVSQLEHLKTMNFEPNHGDERYYIQQNVDIFVRHITDNKFNSANAIAPSQMHSVKVVECSTKHCGDGVEDNSTIRCDGIVTESRGVIPIIKTADCVPMLFCGHKKNGKPVVAAVHAGWRGSVGGIAIVTMNMFRKLGVTADNVLVAIGPCIHSCCFEVKNDFVENITKIRGEVFAKRYVYSREDKLYADLVAMNRDILLRCGVLREHIDISDECTCCNEENKYHSHRKSNGNRGAQGSAICILN